MQEEKVRVLIEKDFGPVTLVLEPLEDGPFLQIRAWRWKEPQK